MLRSYATKNTRVKAAANDKDATATVADGGDAPEMDANDQDVTMMTRTRLIDNTYHSIANAIQNVMKQGFDNTYSLPMSLLIGLHDDETKVAHETVLENLEMFTIGLEHFMRKNRFIDHSINLEPGWRSSKFTGSKFYFVKWTMNDF